MAEKKCGYCTYLDISVIKEGKYYCEKTKEWKFATSSDAENCYRFCERFRSNFGKAEDAIKASAAWQKNNEPYTSIGCFITTAVVDILGIKDNCEDLMTLRKFRKEYLQSNPECRELLMKYDAVGPIIARAIKSDPNNEAIALDMMDIFIGGCVDYVTNGKYAEAIVLYTEMVETLMSHYGVSYVIGKNLIDQYDQSKGGHGSFMLKA